MGLSERNSTSAINLIFSAILDGVNFTLTVTDNILTVQLGDNVNGSFVFDIETGLVYDLSFYENFTYEGAISCQSNGNCPYLFAYTVVNNFHQKIKYKGDMTPRKGYVLPEYARKGLADGLASFAAASAVIFISNAVMFLGVTPFIPGVGIPIAVAGALILAAYGLNWYSKNYDYSKANEETLIDLITSF